MQQLSLFPAPVLKHGGKLNRGKRKLARPLATSRPIHLVLKAERHFGDQALLVLFEAHRLAPRFEINLRDSALEKDHVHLLFSTSGREEYTKYVRSLSALLARKFGKGIWLLSPFTRVVSWGKDYQATRRYLEQNRMEAAGAQPYKPRKV